MSLECDQTGSTCVECGVFDFLPTKCPYCGGIYCRDHLHHHRVYQEAGAAAERPWCTRPERTHTLPEGQDGAPRREDPLCVVCQSKYCVLVPCARCEQNFCAAHRFHGHEEDGRRPTADKRRRKAELAGEDGEAATLEALCAPHTSATPLRVAPADYRSRMVEWVCLLLEPPAPLQESGTWHLGVCSVSAAGESSVGQNVQRLLDELPCAVADGDGTLPLLYTLGTASGEGSRAPGRGAPQVEVVPFTDWGAVSRLAFPPSSALVLVLAPAMEATRVAAVLQQLLFPTRKDGTSDAPEVVGPAKDVRLNAVATRLHLHRLKASAAAAAASAAGEEPAEMVETAQAPAQAGLAAAEKPADKAADAGWPFRTAPPLTGRSFKGTKLQPLGSQQVGTAARVTVAVWVEDRHLPQPLPPLCMALGKEWSLGKAQGRILEECGPSLSVAATAAGAVLYLLSTTGATPMRELATTSAPTTKVGDVLKDGDVLWLSLSGNAHSGNAALQTEVDRLRTLKGKEQTALRLEMMQKCSLM